MAAVLRTLLVVLVALAVATQMAEASQLRQKMLRLKEQVYSQRIGMEVQQSEDGACCGQLDPKAMRDLAAIKEDISKEYEKLADVHEKQSKVLKEGADKKEEEKKKKNGSNNNNNGGSLLEESSSNNIDLASIPTISIDRSGDGNANLEMAI